MSDNSIKIQKKDISVYESDIYYYFDECIDIEFNGKKPNNKDIKEIFPYIMIYIQKHCIKLDNYNNIQLIDSLFDIFVQLCMKYSYNPTIFCFSLFSGISLTTIEEWYLGITRVSKQYSDYAKKWIMVCRNCLANDLNNSNSASINKIFVSKAVYGMREDAQVQPQQSYKALTATELPRLDISDDA